MNRRYHDRALSRSHRRHVLRRWRSKWLVLSLVLGVISLLVAAMFGLIAVNQGNSSGQAVALGFGVLGGVFVASHALVAFASSHRKTRRGPASSRSGSPAPTTPSSLRSKAGVALVLVLALVAVLGALCLTALRSARQTIRLQESRRERAVLQTAIVDAVRRAMQLLADDENLLVDHPGEPWALSWERLRSDDVGVFLLMEDENRRFDANNLAATSTEAVGAEAQRMLSDLLNECGDFTPVSKVDALHDWVDANQSGAYEADAYRRADPAYAPPDAPLLSLAELLHVRGFDRPQFERRPAESAPQPFGADRLEVLAIVPEQRRLPVPVNVNTAGRPVLNAVFGAGREHIVDYILSYRRYEPFSSLDGIAVLDGDPLFVDRIRPFVDVKSDVFTIRVRAHRGATAVEARILVRRQPSGEVRVLRWVA